MYIMVVHADKIVSKYVFFFIEEKLETLTREYFCIFLRARFNVRNFAKKMRGVLRDQFSFGLTFFKINSFF